MVTLNENKIANIIESSYKSKPMKEVEDLSPDELVEASYLITEEANSFLVEQKKHEFPQKIVEICNHSCRDLFNMTLKNIFVRDYTATSMNNPIVTNLDKIKLEYSSLRADLESESESNLENKFSDLLGGLLAKEKMLQTKLNHLILETQATWFDLQYFNCQNEK